VSQCFKNCIFRDSYLKSATPKILFHTLIKQRPKSLIKTIATTLSLVLPIAASFNKFALDENAYKTIEGLLNKSANRT
jgi:hypothetical protein